MKKPTCVNGIRGFYSVIAKELCRSIKAVNGDEYTPSKYSYGASIEGNTVKTSAQL